MMSHGRGGTEERAYIFEGGWISCGGGERRLFYSGRKKKEMSPTWVETASIRDGGVIEKRRETETGIC